MVLCVQKSAWLTATLYGLVFHASAHSSQVDVQGALVAHIYAQYYTTRTHDVPTYIKTLVTLLDTSQATKPTKGFTVQYKRAGGYQQALQDFASLHLQMVRDITNNHTNTGKVGQLPDGRMVNVRMKSSIHCYPTLEIQNRPRKDTIKFRYGGDA